VSWGGKRQGAGRPRGSGDKRCRATAEGVAQSAALTRQTDGTLLLEYMLRIMNDEADRGNGATGWRSLRRRSSTLNWPSSPGRSCLRK
jgi:hypothetical protein